MRSLSRLKAEATDTNQSRLGQRVAVASGFSRKERFSRAAVRKTRGPKPPLSFVICDFGISDLPMAIGEV